MDLLTALLLGIIAVFLATFFPGMLNMTVVSTSLRVGRRAGYRFVAGLSLVLTLQAGIAMIFADYLANHPGIITGMKQWAVLIFLTLAIVFLGKGYRIYRKREEPEDQPYHGSPFWRGAGMAVANFLTLPYFFAAGGWLLSSGYLGNGLGEKLLFTTGAGIGSALIFGTYAKMAEWIRNHAEFLTRNINFILGGLFALLALIQGVRVYY